MPHRGPGQRPTDAARGARVVARLGALIAVAAIVLGPLALTGAAAEGLTMSARVLVQGHARAGTWMAIEVTLQNDGPQIDGELRMDGGAESTARYAMAVKLPTESRQTYVLHAQPPGFGRNVKVDLVAGGQLVDSATVAYLVHDSTQLVIGVLAERPAGIVSQITLPVNAVGVAPAVVPLTIADLPERVEGWAVIDRLVWQDVDSNRLSGLQLESLRRWLAAGGRLIIVGGSAGIGTLSALPDDILPFRPTATLDVDPALLTGLIGQLPQGATELPAMAGALSRGRALATSGDRVVAADLGYGNGRITIIGFDPTTSWLADSENMDSLWRGLLPERSSDGSALVNDGQLVQAVYQLPALALPPTAGLLAIIGAYVLIIGPLNYLILRRLDRRELAWITMPVLVLGFSAAAFAYGSFLRGTDVVVNEVAIVRGAPDATEGQAQVYFGIFSPTRSTYQVQVPQGALLASPMTGDGLGTLGSVLDILQGTGAEQPSAVRNLAVGTGSFRVIRAQLPITAPRMRATLELSDGVLVGTFENASDQVLEGVAVVLGSSVQVLGDIAAHATAQVRLPIQANPFLSGLADQVVGVSFDNSTEEGVRRSTRYSMVQQLTYDPMGSFSGALSADQAVILAFGRSEVLDLQVGGQQPRRNGNVLYYVPVGIDISGAITFSNDLLRPTVVDGDAQSFHKERNFLSLGFGQATFAYRPIPFDGTFDVREIRLTLGTGGEFVIPDGGKVIEPLPSPPVPCEDANNTTPAGCVAPRDDFLPEVDVFDRSGDGAWVRLPRLAGDARYTLAEPDRYVDPATGQMLVRFVNESLEMTTTFGFQLALSGTVQ